MNKAIDPLFEYIKKFDEFLDILKSNADQKTKDLEMSDQPPDIDSIKTMIDEVYKKKKELMNRIPE